MLIFFNKVMLPSVFQWQMDSMYAAFSILQADSPRNLPRSCGGYTDYRSGMIFVNNMLFNRL